MPSTGKPPQPKSLPEKKPDDFMISTTGERPLPWLGRLLRILKSEPLSQIQLMASLLFTYWSHSKGWFSVMPPWPVTIHGGGIPDPLNALARLMLGYAEGSPSSYRIDHLTPEEEEALDKRIQRAIRILSQKSPTDATVRAYTDDLRACQTKLAAGNKLFRDIGLLSRLWHPHLGWFSQSAILEARIETASDIDRLSRLLKRTPEALRHPVTVRSDDVVPISLRVSGAIPAKDWTPPLVEAILREELPMLFLPHFTGAVEIPENDLKLFENFAFRHRLHIHNPRNRHRLQSGNHAVDQRWLASFGWLRDLEARLWDRLNQIPFPGYRYFIMETLHRLEAASWRLIQDFARPGTTHDMMCPWVEDLLWCAARSLEISVESLGFHGIGIQARDTQLPLPKALAFIRSHPAATGVTPRQMDRHFGIRKEARDRVLDELQRLGLVIRHDRRVVATRFDEFIQTLVEDPSIPHRRLSLMDLADTKPDRPPYADLQHLAGRF